MKWPMLTVLMFHLCVAKLLLGPEPGPVPTPDLDSELIPYNPAPCQPARNSGMNERFNEHHLCKLSKYGTDPTLWTKYIKKICNNKSATKSFLDKSEQPEVEGVCSPSGGKLYKKGENLCISKKTFSYVEVRWDNNCIVENVENKTQYIILACDKIGIQCLPVHFEENPKNRSPNNDFPDCGCSSSEEEGVVEVEGNEE